MVSVIREGGRLGGCENEIPRRAQEILLSQRFFHELRSRMLWFVLI